MDADLLRAAAARLRLLNPACGEKLIRGSVYVKMRCLAFECDKLRARLTKLEAVAVAAKALLGDVAFGADDDDGRGWHLEVFEEIRKDGQALESAIALSGALDAAKETET